MPGGEGPLRAVLKGVPPDSEGVASDRPELAVGRKHRTADEPFLVLWPVYCSEQFRSIFPMAKSGQPIPSALAAVAATKSNP